MKTNYEKSKKGLIAKIYTRQRASSKQRGHHLPYYNLIELRSWVYLQPIFHKLYNNRVESGYNTKLIPSIDRLDDYKGYSLDNIQLMTWIENKLKGESDIKNGINNKQSKSVKGINTINGKIVEYHSIQEAGRRIKISPTHISACCKGKRKSAGGYTWRYT